LALALTPSNNDAFFREVDEEVRRDRLAAFWSRRGGTVLLGLGLFLVALAAGLWWKSHRAALAARDGEQLSAVLADVEANRVKPGDPRLAALAHSSRPGYRALAELTAAGVATATDPKGAAARYRQVADDASLPRPLRDLAQLRAVTLQFDGMAPQAVVDALKPLAQPGAPWFGPAGEMTGAAYLKMNRRDLAGPIFAQLAREPGLPASLQARAATMASALGQAVVPAQAGALKE
jgi:hypothetical protein